MKIESKLTAAQATIARLEGEKFVLIDMVNTSIVKLGDKEAVQALNQQPCPFIVTSDEGTSYCRLAAAPPKEAQPCCTQYDICQRACTPRGEWIAEQRLKGYL